MKPADYPEVSIRWGDHWIDHGDFTMEDIQAKAKPIYGIYKGHKVFENKQVMVVCANVWEGEDGEANFSDPMFIMKRTIDNKGSKL